MPRILIITLASVGIILASDHHGITCNDYKGFFRGAGCCDEAGNHVDTTVSSVLVKEEPARTFAWRSILPSTFTGGLANMPAGLQAVLDGKTFQNTFWTHPFFDTFPYGKSEITFYMKPDKHIAYMCDFNKDADQTVKECTVGGSVLHVNTTSTHEVIRIMEPYAKYVVDPGPPSFKYGGRYRDFYIAKDGSSMYYKSKVYVDTVPAAVNVTTMAANKLGLLAGLSATGGPCGDNPVVPGDWQATKDDGNKQALYKAMGQLAEVTSVLPAELGQCLAISMYTPV
jgi:hypothetical protein